VRNIRTAMPMLFVMISSVVGLLPVATAASPTNEATELLKDLKPNAKRAFNEYIGEDRAKAFAVSVNGDFFGFGIRHHSLENAKAEAVGECESAASGPCRIIHSRDRSFPSLSNGAKLSDEAWVFFTQVYAELPFPRAFAVGPHSWGAEWSLQSISAVETSALQLCEQEALDTARIVPGPCRLIDRNGSLVD